MGVDEARAGGEAHAEQAHAERFEGAQEQPGPLADLGRGPGQERQEERHAVDEADAEAAAEAAAVDGGAESGDGDGREGPGAVGREGEDGEEAGGDGEDERGWEGETAAQRGVGQQERAALGRAGGSPRASRRRRGRRRSRCSSRALLAGTRCARASRRHGGEGSSPGRGGSRGSSSPPSVLRVRQRGVAVSGYAPRTGFSQSLYGRCPLPRRLVIFGPTRTRLAERLRVVV